MSNINPQNIDGAYPIAGQDNNSQGFRDNFTNTVNNFTFAAAELTDLQTYAVLKGPLGSVGQTGTPTNVMDYTFITEPQLLKAVETKKDIAEPGVNGDFEVDWSQGHFQTVTVTSEAGMTFAPTWPTADLWTKLRLQITATTLSNIDISGTYIENLQNIQGATGNSLQLNTGIYLFDFTTYDAGAHVWIQDVTRNYDEPLSFNTLTVSGNVLAEGLSIFGNTRVGLAGKPSGQWHTVVGNITQTTAGGPVYINTTGNISASTINAATYSATGNILATGLSVFGNTRIGSLAIPGAEHTIIGNVSVSGAGTEYFNIAGNILAVQGSFGSINSTGLINTTGNVLAAAYSGGAVTVTGAITTSGTAGIGYVAGAGGTIAQGSGSEKNTTVVLNKTTGTITLNGGICFANARVANAFTLTNSTIGNQDLVVIQHVNVGALGGYSFAANTAAAGGSATIYVRNNTQLDLSEAIVIRFAVIKSTDA
jgi:hypothetical protein